MIHLIIVLLRIYGPSFYDFHMWMAFSFIIYKCFLHCTIHEFVFMINDF